MNSPWIRSSLAPETFPPKEGALEFPLGRVVARQGVSLRNSWTRFLPRPDRCDGGIFDRFLRQATKWRDEMAVLKPRAIGYNNSLFRERWDTSTDKPANVRRVGRSFTAS